MMTPRGLQAGLTLVEVVIALLILVVGVLAVAGLQASGLNATRTAQAMQRLNTTARSEVDVWRSAAMTNEAPLTRSCATTGTGCVVEIRPCVVTGARDLDCGVASAAVQAAHAVTVTVTDDEREVVLRTVVMR